MSQKDQQFGVMYLLGVFLLILIRFVSLNRERIWNPDLLIYLLVSFLRPSTEYTLTCFGVSSRGSIQEDPALNIVIIHTPSSCYEILKVSVSQGTLCMRLFGNFQLDGMCLLMDEKSLYEMMEIMYREKNKCSKD